jgi:hypothetical protein
MCGLQHNDIGKCIRHRVFAIDCSGLIVRPPSYINRPAEASEEHLHVVEAELLGSAAIAVQMKGR